MLTYVPSLYRLMGKSAPSRSQVLSLCHLSPFSLPIPSLLWGTGCGREEQRWQAEEVAICEIFAEKGEIIERSWELGCWTTVRGMGMNSSHVCTHTHTHMHIYMCFHDKYIHRYKQKLRWMLESVYIICIYIYIYMYIFTHFKHFLILSTERA